VAARTTRPVPTQRGHRVSIEGVSRRFGDVHAVDDVWIDVPAGEFLSILGPSGCGKTTLLRMIAGLDYPNAGRILIDERDVTWLPANKRPTNLVFQRGALFPHKSVFDNVAYPLQRLGYGKAEIREPVEDALAMVRMTDFARRLPSELSGGQAQRVALSRALVGRPAVLLLDEPLAALDLALRKEMQLELRRLQEQLRTTFIYVTHDQEEALTMSSRIVIMRDGHVVQTGTPREIYDNPESMFASTFIGETNLLLGDVVDCGDGIVTVSVAGRELRVRDGRNVAKGSRIALSVRPERIRTGDPTDRSDWNRLSGTVEELVFLGNRIRARVDCAGISLWTQDNPSSSTANELEEQVSTTVGWALADGRLILREDGSGNGISSRS
jgi:spermidine/putrescine transport system ATP-binding protein